MSERRPQQKPQQTPLNLETPVLYSFRRCPYAIRARMALKYSGICVQHREVDLSNKPESMLACSPKGTVPVLVLADSTVIDESRDIIDWALSINDPDYWLPGTDTKAQKIIEQLIDENDSSFKQWLDKYKYNEKQPKYPAVFYREKGELFLATLETRLTATKFLTGGRMSVADIAIFPFVRQFAYVDKEWFYRSSYKKLQIWLDEFLQSDLFKSIMRKHPTWGMGGDISPSQ